MEILWFRGDWATMCPWTIWVGGRVCQSIWAFAFWGMPGSTLQYLGRINRDSVKGYSYYGESESERVKRKRYSYTFLCLFCVTLMFYFFWSTIWLCFGLHFLHINFNSPSVYWKFCSLKFIEFNFSPLKFVIFLYSAFNDCDSCFVLKLQTSNPTVWFLCWLTIDFCFC